MNTPAISNLINGSNALASGAAPGPNASAASNDMQFNQILSRGIEERRAQPEPTKPVEKESPPPRQAKQATQSSTAAHSAAKTNKSQSAESKTASADQEPAAPAAEGATAKVEHGKSGDQIDKESDDGEAALAASADELLALVASLTQAATPAAPTEAAADDTAQAAAVDADAAATADAALGANTAALVPDALAPAALAPATLAPAVNAPAVNAPAADLARTVGKKDIPDETAAQTAAQAALTELRDRGAPADATRPEEPGADREFGDVLGQAKDKQRATHTDAGLREPQSGEKALPAAAEPRPEPRAAKPAADRQPVVTTVAAMNIAPHAQVSLQQAQAAAAVAADRLTPRVGSNGWDQALGQKVVWMVSGEIQSASLTLNPPDLGPLEVVLNVSNNQANVSFTAAQPEVRQALEDAVPKLKEMLGDAGIQLGQANVSAGTPNNHESQFGNQRHGAGGAGRPMDEGVEDPVRPQRAQAITAGGEGLVDTFA